MKFWDFNSMDSSCRAFRTLQPFECHQIKSIQYSQTGDSVLIAAGNAQVSMLYCHSILLIPVTALWSIYTARFCTSLRHRLRHFFRPRLSTSLEHAYDVKKVVQINPQLAPRGTLSSVGRSLAWHSQSSLCHIQGV